MIVVFIVTIIILIIFNKDYDCNSLEAESGKCLLAGQLKNGISSAYLPNPPGRHFYKITASGGKLSLNHHAFNPDGFTWSLPPAFGEQEHFDIEDKTSNTFMIIIRESFGQNDRVEIVNPNYWNDVEFLYKVD